MIISMSQYIRQSNINNDVLNLSHYQYLYLSLITSHKINKMLKDHVKFSNGMHKEKIENTKTKSKSKIS